MTLTRAQKWTVLGIFGVVLVLGAVISAPALHRSSPLFNLMIPPADLYSPLAAADVDLSKQDGSFTVTFQNKYPGLHWFAVEVEKPPAIAEPYRGNVVLDLEVSSEGKVLLKETINSLGSPYLRADRGGFALRWYRAPKELPLGQPLSVTVTVARGDAAFHERHGWSKLVVSKLSDE